MRCASYPIERPAEAKPQMLPPLWLGLIGGTADYASLHSRKDGRLYGCSTHGTRTLALALQIFSRFSTGYDARTRLVSRATKIACDAGKVRYYHTNCAVERKGPTTAREPLRPVPDC